MVYMALHTRTFKTSHILIKMLTNNKICMLRISSTNLFFYTRLDCLSRLKLFSMVCIGSEKIRDRPLVGFTNACCLLV
jgi:hypothetical protein